MPFDPISWWIIATIAASLFVAFWDDIRERVATWLRNKGLSNSLLMDAWIKLDLIAGRVRCRIFGKTRKYGLQEISEVTYTQDQIEDQEILAELRRRGYCEKNIMSQIQ